MQRMPAERLKDEKIESTSDNVKRRILHACRPFPSLRVLREE
jgi:hypothetical protein